MRFPFLNHVLIHKYSTQVQFLKDIVQASEVIFPCMCSLYNVRMGTLYKVYIVYVFSFIKIIFEKKKDQKLQNIPYE